jgi:hypothetical protein
MSDSIFDNSTFRSQSMSLYCIYFSEETMSISLSDNGLIFVIVILNVPSEVGEEFSNFI